MYRHEQGEDAEQAEFLAQDSKDEVRIALGQELQLRLRAVRPALAEQAAGADGDFRLNDVVARAQRVAGRG